ncbi:MAG: hypothetical protein HYU66_15895 [Armatimonadetes bacterium]|nr:hypothetical protein [Armatimonadota bacterium]
MLPRRVLAATWYRRAPALLPLCLIGCSGPGGFAPIAGPGPLDRGPTFALHSFDDGFLSGPVFVRTGASRAAQTNDAMRTALLGVNSFGSRLSAFDRGSPAFRVLDQFVFVPNRSRSRAARTELIHQQQDGLTLDGVLRDSPDDPDVVYSLALHITGPDTDLQTYLWLDAHGHLIDQTDGHTLVERGGNAEVHFRLEGQRDPATGVVDGEVRAEVFRVDGSIEYANRFDYHGDLGLRPEDFAGIVMWFAPDGYWVGGTLDVTIAPGDEATGTIRLHASDGVLVEFELHADGTVTGSVTDRQHNPVGQIVYVNGTLSVLDLNGQPMLDDRGVPMVYTLVTHPPEG